MKRYLPALLLVAPAALAGTDYQCFSDCTARYSYAYCKQVCAVQEQESQVRPAKPVDAFIEGRAARQEEEARQLEIERLRAIEAERMWAEVARQAAEQKRLQDEERQKQEAAERAKLEAENEALRKELERLKDQKRPE